MNATQEHLDDEALLLLFLSGELPEAERIALQDRLTQQPRLAERLAELTAAYRDFDSAFTGDDAATPLPLVSDAACRRVTRAMQQWQVDRLARRAPRPKVREAFRMPWWAYASGVAVAAIVAVVVWSSNLPDATRPMAEAPDEATVNSLIMSFESQQMRSADRWYEAYAAAVSPTPSDDMQAIFFRPPEEQER